MATDDNLKRLSIELKDACENAQVEQATDLLLRLEQHILGYTEEQLANNKALIQELNDCISHYSHLYSDIKKNYKTSEKKILVNVRKIGKYVDSR